MSKSFRLSQRARRLLIVVLLSYPVYLFLLGPFYSLDGRGCLNFMAEQTRDVYYFPSAPIYFTPGLSNLYDDYLNLWYDDPNKPETTW